MDTKHAAAGSSLLSSLVGRFLWLTVGQPRDAAAAALKGMNREEFDRLIARAFQGEGYAVRMLGEKDGGDLIAVKQGRRLLVLTREWRAWKIGMGTVQDFHNALVAHGAAGGFIVTSGRFAGDVVETAPRFNIQLVGGEEMVKLLEKGRKS